MRFEVLLTSLCLSSLDLKNDRRNKTPRFLTSYLSSRTQHNINLLNSTRKNVASVIVRRQMWNSRSGCSGQRGGCCRESTKWPVVASAVRWAVGVATKQRSRCKNGSCSLSDSREECHCCGGLLDAGGIAHWRESTASSSWRECGASASAQIA